jgi:N-acyl-D-amino-acid deacylase
MRYLVCLLLLLIASQQPCHEAHAQEDSYDLVLRNGKIVDGTGNPAYFGDVAIRGDRVVGVGSVKPLPAKRVVDATGLVIAPGFIDIHSHSDFVLLEDGDAKSKIHQGVTTEVLGEGSSAGPLEGKLSPRQVTVGDSLEQWSTLGEYLNLLDRSGVATNVASYVGLNNAWRSVMDDSFDRPTDEQIQAMRQLVDRAMKDGAFGLSSQVMMPPGSLATTDDLVEIAKAVAPYGGIYSSHIRNEGTGVLAAVKEAIAVGERAGIAVDVIHLKIADQQLWGRMNEVVALVEAARQRGVNVQANVYPYTRGNNNLVSIIPPWAHEGGRGKLLERLRDPKQRKQMKHDIEHGVEGWYNHYTAVGRDWSRMLVSGNNRYKGLTMDRVMSLRTRDKSNPDLLDELFELLLEEQGSVATVYAHHTEADMNLAMSQPWCSIGSDGSAYAIDGPLRRGNPHPRNFGTFPRVLGLYVRERKLLRLEDAIRKMTSMNASKIGLRARGLLVPSFFADVTVFDANTVIDRATYTDPFHYNEGIKYVIVNGTIVLDDGEHTGERPGHALHRGNFAP